MTQAVKNLFGNGDIENQRAAAAQSQQRQEELVAQERSNLAAVEEGQRRARSGGRGLLAFTDDLPDLADALGGVPRAGSLRRRLGGAG